MEIKPIISGYSIKVPLLALSKVFHAYFPSARYNVSEQQWEVETRCLKRLEQWVNEAKSAEEDLIADEENEDEYYADKEDELGDAELKRLRERIEEALKKIE